MPVTTDQQAALDLIDLDQNWSDLKSGKTVPELALALLRPLQTSQLGILQGAGLALAHQVETDGQSRAVKGLELAYHNRDHIRDTLVALNLLLKASPSPLSLEDKQVTIVAMVGHDLGHEGLPNRLPRELEAKSWGLASTLLKPLALGRQTLKRLQTIILMTDPKDYSRLAARVRHSVLSIQIGMAVDADLFASLLPSRGFRLGSRLADEQVHAGVPQAKGFATLKGRAMFLKSAPLLSEAIRMLGMPTLIAAQLSVIEQLTESDRLRLWTPSWGDEFTSLVHDHLTRDTKLKI